MIHEHMFGTLEQENKAPATASTAPGNGRTIEEFDMPKGICSVDDCGGSGKIVRGLCGKHYAKWQKYGDPLAGRQLVVDDDSPDKILTKVTVAQNGCWLWTGVAHQEGYGVVWNRSHRQPAHRLSYRIFVGEIPDGLEIDHLCHTRARNCAGGVTCPHRKCVNPEHLEPVTKLENFTRGRNLMALNARKTHCKNGHEFTIENTVIRADGYRSCRECDRISSRKYSKRKASA